MQPGCVSRLKPIHGRHEEEKKKLWELQEAERKRCKAEYEEKLKKVRMGALA